MCIRGVFVAPSREQEISAEREKETKRMSERIREKRTGEDAEGVGC